MFKVLRIAAMVFGAIYILAGVFSTGVIPGGDTLNFGLLVDRIVFTLFGGILWITGIMMWLHARK